MLSDVNRSRGLDEDGVKEEQSCAKNVFGGLTEIPHEINCPWVVHNETIQRCYRKTEIKGEMSP